MKQLTRIVQALAVLCTVATVGLLFLNEPDDAPAPPTEAADGDEDDGDEDEGDDGDEAADGAAVYADACAQCHGGDGGGGIGPQLADGAVVDAFPDVDDQVAIVVDGRGGMPAFGSRLSEAEIEAVVEFTRSL